MWTYIVFLLVLPEYNGQTACPDSCSCSGNNVTCADLKGSFPVDIPRNTRNLKFNNIRVDEIPSNVFEDFENLIYFEISNSTIDKIRAFAFYGLNRTEIIFTGCAVESLEQFAISQMKVLVKLKFHKCMIKAFDSDAISNIDNLGVLEFFESKITTFQSRAVSQIGHLGTVTVYKCYIESLGEGAFSILNKVGVITIASSRIETLDSYAISNSTEVKQIHFVKSLVSEMKSYAISRLGKIEILGAYQSNFTIIRRNAIAKNDVISLFDLSLSRIETFESFAVSDNTAVTNLRLYQVHIGHLQRFAFNVLAIEYADFQYTKIGRLDCGTVEKLKDTVAVRLTFSPVNVTCNSSVCWMFHPDKAKYLKTVFKDVECTSPRSDDSTVLASLSDVPFEDLPFGCNKYDYTRKFTCVVSGSTRPLGQGTSRMVVLDLSLLTLGWLAMFGEITA